MKYGWFDDQNFEYVINRPDTPLPWINYLGNEAYFGLISNTAGGYSFYKDARLRRITRFRYNNAPLDSEGRFIYIRDDASEKPCFWSPTWNPTKIPLDSYECRHGMGYTKVQSKYSGIKSDITYFIPIGHNLEIWDLVITNDRDEPADLSIFSAVEFCLWDALDDATNFQRNYSIPEVEVVDGIIYHKSEYRERRSHFAFFACSEPLAGFDTQRENFLGPYRGWAAPLAVEKEEAGGSICLGWQPIGALHIKVTLKPGEHKRIIFVLGYHENQEEDKFDPPNSQIINKKHVKPVIARFLRPEEADRAFSTLRAY